MYPWGTPILWHYNMHYTQREQKRFKDDNVASVNVKLYCEAEVCNNH